MHYGMNPPGKPGYNYYPGRNQQDRQNNNYTLTVEGKGEVRVVPDQALLSVGVVTENEQLLPAQQENTIKSNQIISAVKQLGIEDTSIKTTLYNIQPKYEYIDGKTIFKGYQVEHQLEILIKEIAKVGEIIDAAFKNGANRGGNVQFIVSTPDRFYREALTKAMIDARSKAEVIANSIGASLKPMPIKITENTVQPPVVFPVFSYKLAAEAAQGAPPIQKGEFTISANVTAVFEYRERY